MYIYIYDYTYYIMSSCIMSCQIKLRSNLLSYDSKIHNQFTCHTVY